MKRIFSILLLALAVRGHAIGVYYELTNLGTNNFQPQSLGLSYTVFGQVQTPSTYPLPVGAQNLAPGQSFKWFQPCENGDTPGMGVDSTNWRANGVTLWAMPAFTPWFSTVHLYFANGGLQSVQITTPHLRAIVGKVRQPDGTWTRKIIRLIKQ